MKLQKKFFREIDLFDFTSFLLPELFLILWRSTANLFAKNKCFNFKLQPDPEPPKPPKKSSIFGDAKPVDTTKKEREIEAKLKTIEVDDVKKERPRGGQNIHPENSNDKNHGTVSHQKSFQKQNFPPRYFVKQALAQRARNFLKSSVKKKIS